MNSVQLRFVFAVFDLSIIFSQAILTKANFCDPYNEGQPPDVLQFTEYSGPPTLAVGFERQYGELRCCATGYTRITWLHTQDDGRTWTDFRPDNITRELLEKGQIAVIRHLNSTTDGGSYKCVLVGQRRGQQIDNIIKMEIRDASSWTYPPKWLNPPEEHYVQKESVGGTVNVKCSSFLGTTCSDDDCYGSWHRLPYIVLPESTNSSDRVRYQNYFRRDSLTMETILTITDFSEDDFGEYNCSVSNRNGDAQDRTVQLKRHIPPVVYAITAALIGACVLFFVLTVVLVNKRTRTDLDIRIYWRTRRRADTAESGKKFDIMFLFAEINQRDANCLKSTLTDMCGFTVSSSDEVEPGRVPIERLPELAMQSRSVLVLLSPDLARDDQMLSVIGDVITHVTPVFVAYGINNLKTGSEDLESLFAENIQGAMGISRPLVWPRSPEDENSPLMGNSGAVEDQVAFRDGSREVKTFFKKLHLSLLKKMELKEVNGGERRRQRTESTRPVLHQNPSSSEPWSKTLY